MHSNGFSLVRKCIERAGSSAPATLDGKPLPHMIQWRGGFGDLTITSPAGDQRTLYFDVTANKLVEQSPKSASKGPLSNSGNFSFAGSPTSISPPSSWPKATV